MQDSQTQARILIVEDSIVQAEILQRILVENGYAVDIAHNGADGWAKVKALRPDLVISDIIMPEMSGFELCRQIRAEENLQDLPVILVTVLFELEDVLEGLASGADNFVTKPYSESRLFSIVRELLASRKLSGKDQEKNSLLLTYGGKKYSIRKSPKKILDFFISTYGIAMGKNVELIQTQRELQKLNEKLEQKVQERALALIAESSQRQEVEEELTRNRLHQEMILNSTWEGILGLDLKGCITFVNPAVARMLGYEAEELIGRNSHSTYHHTRANGSPYPSEECQIYAAMMEGGAQHFSDELFIRKDGTSFAVEGTSTPLRKNGDISGAVVTFWDITQRREAEEALANSFRKLEGTLYSTVTALSSTLELRDPYTAGHQKRVAQLSCAIAREMGFPQDVVKGLQVMGFLHDLGKIAVPAEILSRPGKISAHEFSIIKDHPQVGCDIIKDIEFPWPVAQAILQHHERLDGSGYPNGLADPDIIKEAKILAVADVVEAMASHRPYRPALGIDQALEEITRNRGTLYDPRVVDACVKLFREQGYELL